SVSPSGAVTLNPGANQTFTITAAAGFVVADVTVDGASVGVTNQVSFTNVQGNHVVFASFALVPVDVNMASSGSAFGWSGMTSATSNSGKTAKAGINDNDMVTDVDVQPAGDFVGAWEAAGVTFGGARSAITSVNFINGAITPHGDGFLTANITLQFTADGTTWNDSGWTVSPAYPFNQ